MPLNATSEARLKGVHPDLAKVIQRLAKDSKTDFIVTEGLRTLARQKQLVAAGASKTMRSRHLTGHAVDLAVTVNGDIRWDWPLYLRLAALMKSNALRLGVKMVAGADWATFKDGPHYELDWGTYPPAEGNIHAA